jgi:hypothetical protein
MVQRHGSALACLLILFLISGCGGDGRLPVTGTVSYQGQPIKAGQITFIPDGQMAPAGGAPIVDGAYSIPSETGLPEGNYKVAVSAKDGPQAQDEMPGEHIEPKETIPAKYNADTELRAKVERGSTTHNFNLD